MLNIVIIKVHLDRLWSYLILNVHWGQVAKRRPKKSSLANARNVTQARWIDYRKLYLWANMADDKVSECGTIWFLWMYGWRRQGCGCLQPVLLMFGGLLLNVRTLWKCQVQLLVTTWIAASLSVAVVPTDERSRLVWTLNFSFLFLAMDKYRYIFNLPMRCR